MVNHKTKIKEEYIKTVSDKYFPQLKPLLKRINEPGVQKRSRNLSIHQPPKWKIILTKKVFSRLMNEKKDKRRALKVSSGEMFNEILNNNKSDPDGSL